MTLDLVRYAYTSDTTYGQLQSPGLLLWTVERPWLGNRRWVSCIPEGTYRLVWSRYHRGGYDTWEVGSVPGRSRILIHAANRSEELAGCIAPGQRAYPGGVGASRKALEQLLAVTDPDLSHTLAITYDPGLFGPQGDADGQSLPPL